jgi:hypothetical protein
MGQVILFCSQCGVTYNFFLKFEGGVSLQGSEQATLTKEEHPHMVDVTQVRNRLEWLVANGREVGGRRLTVGQ